MQRIGFLQDGPGSNSMGRLIAFMAAVLGAIMILTGIVFRAVGKDDGGLAGMGIGLFSSGELLKFGQKVYERKE